MTIAKPVFFSETGQLSSVINATEDNEIGFRQNTDQKWDTLIVPNLLNDDINTINNLKNKGYKVMVLLISGRPMNIAEHIDDWHGFAAIWLPGSEGDGVSDILFGDYQSTGKLSYPWPIKAEHGANADDKDLLFNFGYGL